MSTTTAEDLDRGRTSVGKPGATKPPRRGPWMAVAGFSICLVGVLLFLRTTMANRYPDSELPPAAPNPAPIDGQRAYGYLKTICDIGPRIAGSEANTKQRTLVAEHFKKMGATVREQPFVARHPLTNKRVNMVNLIGSWEPDRTERVVIGAHYDTRPFPDQEEDPALKRAKFLGANDGASGVALLMEIAHHLKESPTPWGVDLVIFDGEELVFDRQGEFFLGSKEFGRSYAAKKKNSRSRYVAGFVLDMVGDKNLTIDKEPYSMKLAGGLVDQVWTLAERLDPPAVAFRDNVGTEVLDDHLPLNDAGIPTIDIIDFDYPFWHRAGDLPEQCSAASLQQVGRVVTAWLALPKPPAKKTRR